MPEPGKFFGGWQLYVELFLLTSASRFFRLKHPGVDIREVIFQLLIHIVDDTLM
jgi:hypothetical protein